MKIGVKMKQDDYFNDVVDNVKKSLKDLYKSGDIQDAVIEKTWDYVPMEQGFLRASAVKYKQMYKFKGAEDMIGTEVRFRALNVKKDYENHGRHGFSERDLRERPFNYAWIQEHHQFEHYTTKGTGWHYLQKGLEESKPEIRRMTLEAVRKGLKKG